MGVGEPGSPERRAYDRSLWAGELGDRKLAKKYGVPFEDYKNLLEAQDGKCAICGDGPTAPKTRLSLDHDHSCCPGKGSCGDCIREFLCDHCNKGLGSFRDDPELLMKAAEYIKRFQ